MIHHKLAGLLPPSNPSFLCRKWIVITSSRSLGGELMPVGLTSNRLLLFSHFIKFFFYILVENSITGRPFTHIFHKNTRSGARPIIRDARSCSQLQKKCLFFLHIIENIPRDSSWFTANHLQI